MEHPKGNPTIRHAVDKGAGGLLIVLRGKGSCKPQTEAPCGRQSRLPCHIRIADQNLLWTRPINKVIAKLLARYGKAHILHLLAGNLKGNGRRMIHKNAVAFVCHIKGNIFIGNLRGSTAVLIPHFHHLTVLYKRGKLFAQTVNPLACFQRKLRDHVRLMPLGEIVFSRKHGA